MLKEEFWGMWSVEKMSSYFDGLSSLDIDVSKMPPQATHILQHNGFSFLFRDCYILAEQSVRNWRDYMKDAYEGSDEHLKGVLYWFITGAEEGGEGDHFAFVVETYDQHGFPQYIGFIRPIEGAAEFKSFSVESELFDLVRGHEEIH